MALTCYAIDDELPMINIMTRYIQETEDMVLIGTQTNPRIAAVEIRELKPDVVFTDINMEGLSGIELANLVGDITQVVFVSAYAQHSFESVDWKNYFYLRKPITDERFWKVVSEIKSRFHKGLRD